MKLKIEWSKYKIVGQSVMAGIDDKGQPFVDIGPVYDGDPYGDALRERARKRAAARRKAGRLRQSPRRKAA